MSRRRMAAIALSGAVIAGGTGVAIAAATKDDAKKTEQAILDDAAKRLDVTPEKLRDALAAAQDAQLDEAVKDGDLTQKQADAIEQAREQSGRVLGGPVLRGMHGGPRLHLRGGPRGPGLRGLGLRGGLFGDLAKALGTTQDELIEQLRDGRSVSDVAKANGKTLAGVRSAVKAAAKTRLDKAVADGDLTRKQAEAILEHVDERVAAIGSRRALRLRRGHRHPGPPPGGMRPGEFAPGGAPELAPGGVVS